MLCCYFIARFILYNKIVFGVIFILLIFLNYCYLVTQLSVILFEKKNLECWLDWCKSLELLYKKKLTFLALFTVQSQEIQCDTLEILLLNHPDVSNTVFKKFILLICDCVPSPCLCFVLVFFNSLYFFAVSNWFCSTESV